MLKIGWSKRDVSTTEPVNMPGQFYARISTGIRDAILLNALALEDGEDMVIFLVGDFVDGQYLIDEIREKTAAARPGFPVEKIIYSITHTHCSPSYHKHEWHVNMPHDKVDLYPSEKYRAFLIDKAVEAVLEAYDNRQEGAMAYGYGYAVLSHSRRVTYFDDLSQRPDGNAELLVPINGHASMYGNTNDDMFCGYEGGADHLVNLLYTFDLQGNLTGAVINVPCPSQNSENEYTLTASYWNEVRQMLREKYGDIGILPQCAASGDLAPRPLHYLAAEERRHGLKYGWDEVEADRGNSREKCRRTEIAEGICKAFDEVLSWARKDLIRDAKVCHTVKNIRVERRRITEVERQFAEEQLEKFRREGFLDTGDIPADFKQNSMIAAHMYRLEDVLERYEQQKTENLVGMELHTVRVGDVAFATNAYELYLDFQHRIQARSPFIQTFVVQLTGQPDGFPAGYLATERGAANRGYSATMYCNQVSPQGGQTMVEETVKELKKIYGE